jgi:hypothetical protein
MAGHVGLDPNRDVEWVAIPDGSLMELFAAGELEIFLGFPPEPQESARAGDRARDPKHLHGQALVGLFLLHAVRQQGLRSRSSDRDQALCSRHPQGR